ncbi:hypothetical protein [Massilia sp. YIM B04103]|uniref:hypothetical protein n=1 Tax=Massilia sp. YIM B04103 TaxID=2963106 RepID=UPI00210C0870|nr:hypothetical protein [Massilia sp. YIM B04103]
MDSKFNYGDIIQIASDAPAELRAGERGWIVGIFTERQGSGFDHFPPGVVYTVEYEDGSSAEVHEMHLRLDPEESRLSA